jgi:hypothetical protein
MKNNKSKPKVFISSTIYDFHDLRSALKYWLEELGYEVLLSEFNDFPVNPDKNSYQACLEAIDTCHYFILLIGCRVGGWYNKEQQISITQQEYIHANEKFEKDGSIKIVSFVRSNIWEVREDRKGLEKHLAECTDLSNYDKKSISNYSSKIVQDAEFIFNFLQEVGKTDAIQQATKSGTPLPRGNWIHQFSNFHDILSALEKTFNIKTDIAEKRAIFNLKEELINNLGVLLRREYLDESILVAPITHWAQWAYDNRSNSLNGKSQMKMQYLTWLNIFNFSFSCEQLHNLFLSDIISDGIFLIYDNELHAFSDSALKRALVLLNESLCSLMNTKIDQRVELANFEIEMRKTHHESDIVEIDNIKIIWLLSLYTNSERVITLSKLVLKRLDGDENALEDFDKKLISRIPFKEDEEAIARERCTREDILEWVASNS